LSAIGAFERGDRYNAPQTFPVLYSADSQMTALLGTDALFITADGPLRGVPRDPQIEERFGRRPIPKLSLHLEASNMTTDSPGHDGSAIRQLTFGLRNTGPTRRYLANWTSPQPQKAPPDLKAGSCLRL
jgi:hypothetical protein